MKRFFLILFGCTSFFAAANAQVNVLTYHNDNFRDGDNFNETILTPANVNTTNFGRLFTNSVDGYVYAQPLYVSHLPIPGNGTHNVVFICTEHNSVYAFDADSNSGPTNGLLWHVNLGSAAATTIAGVFTNKNFGTRYNGNAYTDIVPETGITGTPVIDLNLGTLFVDAFTGEISGGVTNYFHRIHALNITNGAEQSNSPVVVAATFPGIGIGSSGEKCIFNAQQQLQRSALTLANGILYVNYAGYADTDPYQGWIIGYNETNLTQLTNYVFNTEPNATIAKYGANAGEGGIWMAGGGLAVDANNNLYFEVANGTFTATNNSGGTEYGDCFIKLSTTNGLKVADYFTPYNQATWAANDTDLGSGGPMLLPDQSGSHPRLLVGSGKAGTIFLINRDQFTTNNNHYDSTGPVDFVVQSFTGKIKGAFDTPAYLNGRIYYAASGDNMKSFSINNGFFSTTAASTSRNTFSFPGATPSVSANGSSNGIIWALQVSSLTSAATLIAYSTNLSTQLYTSAQATGNRDQPGGAVKFAVPTIANGKVYAGGQYSFSVFGTFAGTLAFSNSDYSVPANAGTATIAVNRIGGTQGAVSVSYVTSAGTAVSGANYNDVSGSLNWSAGDGAPKNFSVPVFDNPQTSSNVTVNLTLSSPMGSAGLGGQSTATLTILPPPTIVTLGATAITTNSAVLSGSVNPNGAATTAWFKWGAITDIVISTFPNSIGSGNNAMDVGSMLSGLQPGMQYSFQLIATNIYGATSTITNFVTPDIPRVISGVIQLAPGQFALRFTGSTNVNYTVLESSNVSLPPADWIVLGPATLVSNNVFQFTDIQATNMPQRFYRLESQ